MGLKIRLNKVNKHLRKFHQKVKKRFILKISRVIKEILENTNSFPLILKDKMSENRILATAELDQTVDNRNAKLKRF